MGVSMGASSTRADCTCAEDADADATHGARILDVDTDSLVLCASKLGIEDLANMAMSCRRLRDVAYADPIWNIQCRIRWPPKETCSGFFQFCGGREAYLSRFIASQQFRFRDPVEWHFEHSQLMIKHILLDGDTVLAAQGSNVLIAETAEVRGSPSMCVLRDHNARINCMRLFSTGCLGSFRNCLAWTNKVLVTCSADHTIRLWGKDRPLRTLRGHSGAVNVIADKILGQGVLASGAMDGTVRLWTLLGSHRKRSPLQATLHGHESYVKELAVAGHNPAILVSAAKDSKLRVWDVNTASTVAGSGGCVGMARGPGAPTSLRCVGSMCYISGGSAVAAIDLRTMQTVGTVAVHQEGILATAISPSGWVFCTGGNDRSAKLWDVRKCGDNTEPFAVLGNHKGPVHCVHLDSFKVITGGLDDCSAQVWDADGILITSLDHDDMGVSALASNGTRVATAAFSETSPGIVRYRDFSNCVDPVEQILESGTSKFWDV